MPVKQTLLVFCLFLIAVNSQAFDSDFKQAIQIQSDRAEHRELDGITEYLGNVQIRQGSMLLKAARVRLTQDDTGISRLVATGIPQQHAYYEQETNEDNEKVIASGLRIEYILKKNLIQIIGKAKLTQQGATLSGHKISYDVEKQLLRTSSAVQSDNKTERVNVVIPPFKK